MPLRAASSLVQFLGQDAGDWSGTPTLSGCAVDSRDVTSGAVFTALSQDSRARHEHIAQAFAQGAGMILTPFAEDVHNNPRVIYCSDLADRVADILCWFYGSSSEWQGDIEVYGVTGTHGKTSTTSYMRTLLDAIEVPAVSLGTLGMLPSPKLSERGWPATGITTPTLHQLPLYFSRAREAGTQAMCLEVSSQAIAEGRVGATTFSAMGITSLGRDHLDFHGTLEAYHKTKCDFVAQIEAPRVIAFEPDDGSELEKFNSSLRSKGKGAQALELIRNDPNKQPALSHSYACWTWYEDATYRCSLLMGGAKRQLNCSARAAFQLENLCFAAAMLNVAGRDAWGALDCLSELPQVEGRLEQVVSNVYVDFAHTPDSVISVLAAISARTQSAIVAVIGCGGDRDRSKRRPMVDACLSFATVVVVTEDNSRSEPLEQIFADMLHGLDDGDLSRIETIADRYEAIERARELQGEGIVVVLGRGHETRLIRNSSSVRMSDAESIRAIWSED